MELASTPLNARAGTKRRDNPSERTENSSEAAKNGKIFILLLINIINKYFY